MLKKTLIILIIFSCNKFNIKKLSNHTKQLELEEFYSKEYVSIKEFISYMEERNIENIKKLNIGWINNLLEKDEINDEDLDNLTKLGYMDQKFILPILAPVILSKINIFKKLWDKREEFCLFDGDGNTVLHYASYFGRTEMVKEILKDQISMKWLNKLNTTSLSPAHIAAMNGHKEILEIFFEYEKDSIVKKDSLGNTPLMFSIAYNHLEATKFLIDKDKEYNISNAFIYSVLSGEKDMLKFLEEKLNFKKLNEIKNKKGANLLMLSIQSGHIDLVDYLSSRISLNKVDDLNRNLLFYAIKGNEVKSIDYLVKKGLFTEFAEHVDDKEYNILAYAIKNDSKKSINKILELLDKNKVTDMILECIENENIKDDPIIIELIEKLDITSIEKINEIAYFSIYTKKNSIAKYILDKIENLKEAQAQVIAACLVHDNFEIFNLLLKKGIDLGFKYNDKEENKEYTLKELAQELEAYNILKIIEEKESKNSTIKDNLQEDTIVKDTYLHKAVMIGDIELVELLVDKGADLNIKNKEGQTPLDIAILNRNKEIVKLLLEKGALID